MIVRLAMGLGLIALSYYIGREVGRTEHWRNEEQRRRSELLEPDNDDDGVLPPDHSAKPDRGLDP